MTAPSPSPQRFARAAPPSVELLATSYWRACRAAESNDAQAQSDAMLQMVRLADFPRLHPLVKGKVESVWVGEK